MKKGVSENNKVYDVFCQSVKRLLKELEIKQKDFCYRIGLSESQFANKINNLNGKFNLQEMLKISFELAESIEDLATGNI